MPGSSYQFTIVANFFYSRFYFHRQYKRKTRKKPLFFNTFNFYKTQLNSKYYDTLLFKKLQALSENL
jgi:hypothetical protein